MGKRNKSGEEGKIFNNGVIKLALSKIVEVLKSEALTKAGKINFGFGVLMFLGIFVITAGSTIRYIGMVAQDTLKSLILNQNICSDNPDPNALELYLVLVVFFVICMVGVYIADYLKKREPQKP